MIWFKQKKNISRHGLDNSLLVQIKKYAWVNSVHKCRTKNQTEIL